jgi:hypothetical protein
MNRIFSSLALTLALVAAGPALADSSYHPAGATYEGKGELKASGFGNAEAEGYATVKGEGIGTVKAPAGIKYRSSDNSMLWKTTDGKDISGLGWIVLKLAGQKVRFEGIATVMGRTRWGLKATVKLEGSGTVKTNGLECQEGCDG